MSQNDGTGMMHSFDAQTDGWGWSGHDTDGDVDGMSGFGDPTPTPSLTLPGGQVIPLDLGGGPIPMPGIPGMAPQGPPVAPPTTPQVQVQTGEAPTWIAGVPNALTIVGAAGLLFLAVSFLKK